MIRIWLKKGTENDLPGVFKSKADRTGKKYIEIPEHPLDPTAEIPEIPANLVECVTFRHRIDGEFVGEGIYTLEDGSTALVENRARTHSSLESTECEHWQVLNIKAPSLEAVKQIYQQIREQELAPTSNWSGSPFNKDLRPSR